MCYVAYILEGLLQFSPRFWCHLLKSVCSVVFVVVVGVSLFVPFSIDVIVFILGPPVIIAVMVVRLVMLFFIDVIVVFLSTLFVVEVVVICLVALFLIDVIVVILSTPSVVAVVVVVLDSPDGDGELVHIFCMCQIFIPSCNWTACFSLAILYLCARSKIAGRRCALPRGPSINTASPCCAQP